MMFARIIRTLLPACCGLCLLPAAQAQTADWSAFFRDWENGCQERGALAAFTDSMGMIEGSSAAGFRLSQAPKLPAAYRRQAAGQVSFQQTVLRDETGIYELDQVRLALSGTYYGIPVRHYSQTFMLETAGIQKNRLLLDIPIEQARQRLAGKYRPRSQFNEALQKRETLQAVLLPVEIDGKVQTVLECSYVYG